jgi:hypothetical protein
MDNFAMNEIISLILLRRSYHLYNLKPQFYSHADIYVWLYKNGAGKR